MNERWGFRLTAKVIKSENLTFPMYMFLSESLIIAMADIDAKIKAQHPTRRPISDSSLFGGEKTFLSWMTI